MEKKKEKRSVLACTICDTELKVPLCCKKQMQVKEGILICTLCNSEEDIPVCCENAMISVNA